MAKIKLEFDPDRVTIGDLVELEQGFSTATEMRALLLKFVVDEMGKVVKGKRAIAMLNKLTVSEVIGSIGKLGEIAKDELVPPQSGGS